jgi:glycosyltransferase involved in cell wall biosynthesis
MADAEAAAETVAGLLAEPLPEAARGRLAARAQQAFRFESYAFRLLQMTQPEVIPVSVAVPAYNHARFLERRLASVFSQAHPVAEVIVLDDASTDDSVGVAQRTAQDWGRAIRMEVNAINSGSPFQQWWRAAMLAEREWLWIAEADDDAEPDLLASLAALAREVPNLELVFCDSRAIDDNGQPLWASYREYYAANGAEALARGGVFAARDFAWRFLAERNFILNVSAVLWRRESLLAALDRCGSDLDRYRLAGDWRLYLEVLAESAGQVGVVPKPLNLHRRHSGSVTSSLPAESHLAEVVQVQKLARARLKLPAETVRRQSAYRRHLARELGLKVR